MLILAGATIATLTGDNGIITRANQAKEETEEAEKEEENILSSYEDKINEYVEIDWDTALANAQKHPDQVTSTAIGVGTDGKAVNMDLWEYTLLDNGTYALNNDGNGPGYKGEFTSEGEIQGRIPQYISTDNGTNFIQVTDLTQTFKNLNSLKKFSKIPETVTI